ncbi:MAG: hypothetical protein R3E09_05955 [Novosphingobium sp.]
MPGASICCARQLSVPARKPVAKPPDPMRTVRTTCAYCGVGCGISASVNGGRTVKIAGDKEHPASHGGLCSRNPPG